MSWENILSHERAKKILQRAILEDKIASAYLLWGLEGIGKDSLALEFAKTVNCLNPIIRKDEIIACDNCRSCKQAKALTHPNIQLIYSLPSGKGSDTTSESPLAKLSDEQISEITEQLKLKSENVYHKISVPNATQIKIASIREVKKNLLLTSNTSGRRVVIVLNAEEMTTEAANAFLKTLEEPHENITIILTSSKKEMLMQTILSRCQQIHCEPVPELVVAQYLVDNYDKSPAEAKIIANFSQGSVVTAIEFLNENIQDMRTDIVETLRSALKKNYRIELSQQLEKLASSKDKNKIETSLKMLQIWMRDYLIFVKTGSIDAMINQDQKERIIKFSELFPEADIPSVLSEIEHSIYRLRRNANLQLLLMSLFLKIRKFLLKVDF